MPPSLDYKIDILLVLLRIRVEALRGFYNEGEAHFSTDFDKLTAETDHLTVAEWEQHEDFFIGQRDGLESLRQLKRHFAIAGLFNVFDTFLRDALDQLDYAEVDVPEPEHGKRWSFDDIKKIFAGIGVPITKPDRDWNAIRKLQAIRHCITHCDGIPNEEIVRKLKGYNFHVPQDVWMELPDGYFKECADLAERVCNRIVKACHDKFPSR